METQRDDYQDDTMWISSTINCDLFLVVSKPWEATKVKNPAVRVAVKGNNGLTSSFNLSQDKHT